MSFLAFAAAHGLILDYPIADGRWHRVKTEDHPRKKNGSYLWDPARGIGVTRNWATMDECAIYRDDSCKVDEHSIQKMRARIERARKEEIRRRNRAADMAQDMVQRATLIQPAPGTPWRPWRPGREAVLAHPYLIRKGLPNASSLVLDGYIVVPMWLGKRLVNVQRIAGDGEKRFLPGGTAKGAFHRIGSPWAREQWLVEGYATGLSVQLALKQLHADAAVVVCFSVGNLKECGGTHVFADCGPAGQKGAEATGLPWVSAEGPDGFDANDLFVRDGLGAVVKLIQTVRARAL